MSSLRKTYTYGRKLQQKRKQDSQSWGEVTMEASPEKFPKKNGIWAKVSVSPFKESQMKKPEKKTIDDPFGFQNEDPYNFDDNVDNISEKSNVVKTKGAKMLSPQKIHKSASPKNKSIIKKLSSPPLTPRNMSRIHGKAMPSSSVTINAKYLKTSRNLKKKKGCMTGKSTKIVKKNYFEVKNDAYQVELANSNSTLVTESRKVENENGKQEHLIEFIDDCSVEVITLQKYYKRNKLAKTKKKNVNTSKLNVTNDETNILDRESVCDQNIKNPMKIPANMESMTNATGVDGGEQNEKVKPQSLFAYYDKQDKSKKDFKEVNIYNGVKKNTTEDSYNEEQEVKQFVLSPTLPKSDSSDQLSSVEQDVNVGKKVKSPFKSLNPRPSMRNLRRFSALPTSVSTIESSGEETIPEEEEDEGDEEGDGDKSPPPLYRSALFGFSRAATVVRVKKNEKKLFTVVKNTKHAHECLEHGESQQFKDDLEYLLDGLKPSHNMSTRCLSALELASKCFLPTFRMHMKAHGTIDSIFKVLQDALSDEGLTLCTSTIMYALAKDKLKINFNKRIIGFMLKLLSKKNVSAPIENKDYTRLLKKVRNILEKQELSHVNLDAIDAELLARETLLSFTSQRIGEWFKEEIRAFGGLDHLVDTIHSCSLAVQKKSDLIRSFSQMQRCLLLLCDMTFKCNKNQKYLDSYRDGLVIGSCVRTISFIMMKIDLSSELSPELQECLFAVLRFLTNLSHENDSGGVKICNQDKALTSILRCALYFPQFLESSKTFDFVIVSLGLLINLVEHNRSNVLVLSTSFSPACHEGLTSSESSEVEADRTTPVEALMQLFLTRFEACKEGDLMEELDKLEKEEDTRHATLHYHDDEYGLTCGDKFDDTMEETRETGTEENMQNRKQSNTVMDSNPIALNQKEKKDIKNTLEKAHQHMEDSHVAAYAAMLIGLLAEDNEDHQETIHSLLPEGDFKPMTESLEKILAFMKMTEATTESGFKVVERIICAFKTFGNVYQPHKRLSVEGAK